MRHVSQSQKPEDKIITHAKRIGYQRIRIFICYFLSNCDFVLK
jgi:hypothetical protein